MGARSKSQETSRSRWPKGLDSIYVKVLSGDPMGARLGGVRRSGSYHDRRCVRLGGDLQLSPQPRARSGPLPGVRDDGEPVRFSHCRATYFLFGLPLDPGEWGCCVRAVLPAGDSRSTPVGYFVDTELDLICRIPVEVLGVLAWGPGCEMTREWETLLPILVHIQTNLCEDLSLAALSAKPRPDCRRFTSKDFQSERVYPAAPVRARGISAGRPKRLRY